MAAVRGTGDNAPTSKAGTRLDADYERKLTAEAEAGFDPAALVRRQAGRPSLSGGPGHSNRVALRVDDQTYQAIRRIAEKDHRHISDVVRDAIHRYLEAS